MFQIKNEFSVFSVLSVVKVFSASRRLCGRRFFFFARVNGLVAGSPLPPPSPRWRGARESGHSAFGIQGPPPDLGGYGFRILRGAGTGFKFQVSRGRRTRQRRVPTLAGGGEEQVSRGRRTRRRRVPTLAGGGKEQVSRGRRTRRRRVPTLAGRGSRVIRHSAFNADWKVGDTGATSVFEGHGAGCFGSASAT